MDDPWSQIASPSEGRFVGRRVDADHPYDFFWARDLNGHCLMIFQYPATITLPDQRPRLREINISEPIIAGEPSRFILELTHEANREIFHRLCLDIIDATRECADDRSALATVLRRTWRWHAMLRGGSEDRLSREKQKGLIGELRVLELALLPHFPASSALEFWRGPDGAPKDFSIGSCAIEAKAKRGAARPYIEITSEHQLDTFDLDQLFLAVTYVDEAGAGMSDAIDLNDYVKDIQAVVQDCDAGALGHLDGRLMESGYSDEHDYSDNSWLIGKTRWFSVHGSFPRLSHSNLSLGVEKLRYSVDLAACQAWEVSMNKVIGALKGESA